MSCKHMEFAAHVQVARLEDSGRFSAEITIHCAECRTPFQFLGLLPGVKMNGATVSIDGLEARMAIAPQGAQPNPIQALMGERKFDA